ncbi:MAG: coproporphyrinogen III oxidase [Phycisphaerae bacterium]|nr:coproporphyrinogen III oxidase [Phycisphaerae bacterium]
MNDDLQLPQVTTSVKPGMDPTEQSLDLDAMIRFSDDVNPFIEGVYAHVPFCEHRCHYCDFFTLAGRESDRAAFVARMIDEIQAAPASLMSDQLASIFVGGGTPTILPLDELARLLAALSDRFLSSGTEFSVEANPETVTPELAKVLVDGGVNRVSLGAQSFDPELLGNLQRLHDPAKVERSLGWLREAGISRLSLDLIFAIPGQSLTQWQADLEQAIAFGPEHLSCYGLVYEPGTPLRGRLDRGEVERVDEDLEAKMYEWTIERLGQAGYEQYEISNWSRSDEACRHNLLYWNNRNWWPLGPSASGHLDGWRWRNLPKLGRYLETEGLSPIRDLERLDEDGRIGERLMMGLRCMAGFPQEAIEEMLAGEGGARRRPIMDKHLHDGLLEWSDGHLRLSEQGVLLANVVTGDLLAPPPRDGTGSTQ